ncbi:hypothetical protein [Clostridium butyricum]|uniref:Fe-S oxidoreductase n=1 Tax=Clostridium butyricum TaxID=1492 RepID=A0A6N3H056_CLOBU|nr:hypothetical protein [Clostridium butyricum]EMU54703.1 putative radical SAM domain protein [Clostridium butyricum DKU-01]MBZ5748442.1 Fe-S oxidoreductase [Clostridium butyricum]MDB2154643.1 Fe-S oxidoreductase [Clostridium butyricum]MZI80429.1 Fe-S oxidoreductase [Clostridium butyricum]QMW90895.1 Fe-S oxidoreductase [Clostridium butyricum]
MKFINSIGDKAKDTLLQSIAALLEKNPQSNLPKIVKMSKLLVSDKSSCDMIKDFETSYNEVPDFKAYVDDLINNTDYKILKNFIVNILGSNISAKKKNHIFLSENSSQPRSLIINSNSKNQGLKTLNYNELDKIISESRKMGIFAFIINGSELFSLNYLHNIYEKYSDSLFIPVATGNCIDDSLCKKILKCGNVIPLFPSKNSCSDMLRQNGIPSFNINYIHSLFKKVKFNNDFSNLKTFSLEFNDSTQNEFTTYSLLDLVKNKSM